MVGRDALWPLTVRAAEEPYPGYLYRFAQLPAKPSGLLRVSHKFPVRHASARRPSPQPNQQPAYFAAGLVRGPFLIVLMVLSWFCIVPSSAFISSYRCRAGKQPIAVLDKLASAMPPSLASLFHITPAQPRQLEQLTYYWALACWLFVLYFPFYSTFVQVLVWRIRLRHVIMVWALAPLVGDIGLALIAFLGLFVLVLILCGWSVISRTALLYAGQDGFVKQVVGERLVAVSAFGAALVITYCLHFSFIVLFTMSLAVAFASWRLKPAQIPRLYSPEATLLCVAISGCSALLTPIPGFFSWFGNPTFYSYFGLHHGIESLLFTLRAVDLGSGVSPLLPLGLLTMATVWTLLCPIRRLHLLGDRTNRDAAYLNFDHGTSAGTDGTPSFKGLHELEQKVDELLTRPPSRLRYAAFITWVGYGAYAWLAYLHVGRSIEGACFDVLLLLASFLVLIGLSRALLRFISTWLAIRHLLRRLYWHPARQGFPKYQSSLPGRQKIQWFEHVPNFTALELSLERARQFLRLVQRDAQRSVLTIAWLSRNSRMEAQKSKELSQKLRDALSKAELLFWQALEAETKGELETMARKRRETESRVSDIARIITGKLEPVWRLGTQAHPGSLSTSDDPLVQQGALFVAARTVDYLRHIFPQLVSHAVFVTVTILLVLVGLSSYPFTASDTLLWLSWLIVLVAVTSVIYVFVSMNRDRVLSLLAGTTPGKFNWTGDFTAHMLIYALIPMLGLLSVSFPEALRAPISWLAESLGGKF